MKTNNRAEIKKILEKYNNFSECIIENIKWRDYGTKVEISLNYVWDDEGKIRSNLELPETVILIFQLVQEVHIKNALNETMCTHPEWINWGLNEIALVKVADEYNSFLSYNSLSVPFHQVSFLWDGERRIDVIFSEFELLRS